MFQKHAFYSRSRPARARKVVYNNLTFLQYLFEEIFKVLVGIVFWLTANVYLKATLPVADDEILYVLT